MLEIVPLRPGGPSLEPVLQDYRRRYGLDEMTVLNVLMSALSTRQAQALLALREGRTVGAVLLARQGDEGRIEFLHVLPGAPEAEAELLARAEAELAGRPGLRCISASLPMLEGSNLSQTFRQRGYREIARARLVLDLAGFDREPVLPAGYQLAQWQERFLDDAAMILRTAHQGTDDVLLYPEIVTDDGARRLVERVLCGEYGKFDPALSPVVLFGERLAGLCLTVWHVALAQQGFILDLAVSAAHRRQGLGEAMVAAAACRYQAAGAAALSLAVTLSNRPARGLYERLGFQVEQRFSLFQRDFEPGSNPGA